MMRYLLATTIAAAGTCSNAYAQEQTVREILNRGIDAMGGRATLEAINGAMYEVVSEDGAIDDIYFIRGAAEYVHIAHSSALEGHRALVGDVAWMQRMDAKGSLLVDLLPPETATYWFALTFHRLLLDLVPLADEATVVGGRVVNDVPCTEVVFAADERRGLRVAFSNDTGLPVRMLNLVNGSAKGGYSFDDWVEQGDVKMFTTIVARVPAKVTATFGALPDEVFEPPPAVKALLAHRERAAAMERRLEKIGRMNREEVTAELARVSRERVQARGTPRHADLRREFAMLMNRLRELSHEESAAQAPADEPLIIPERRTDMTNAELRPALNAVVRQRAAARSRGDHEPEELLREKFAWLMDRLRAIQLEQ